MIFNTGVDLTVEVEQTAIFQNHSQLGKPWPNPNLDVNLSDSASTKLLF